MHQETIRNPKKVSCHFEGMISSFDLRGEMIVFALNRV